MRSLDLCVFDQRYLFRGVDNSDAIRDDHKLKKVFLLRNASTASISLPAIWSFVTNP